MWPETRTDGPAHANCPACAEAGEEILTVTVRPSGFTLERNDDRTECRDIAALSAAIAEAAQGTALSGTVPAALDLSLSACTARDMIDALYYAVAQIEMAIEAGQSLRMTDGRFPASPCASAMDLTLRLPQNPVFFGIDMAGEDRP